MGRYKSNLPVLDFEAFRKDHPNAKVYVLDVDHTLTSHATGLRFIMHGLRRGYVRFRTVMTLPKHVLDYHRGIYGVDDIPEEYKDLRGVTREFLDTWGNQVFTKKIRNDLFPAGEKFVREAKAAGITLMLSSATFDFIIAILAKYLGIEIFMSTNMRYENGVCTGEMEGRANFATGKIIGVENAIKPLGFSLADVAFFSDSNNDLPLLEKVGYPVPVHADKKLAAVAHERGWKLYSFSMPKSRAKKP